VPKVRFTPDAQEDINEIGEYLLDYSVGAFDAFMRRVKDIDSILSRYSHIGHVRPDLLDRSFRFLASGDSLFIYRMNDSGVQVVGVVHGSRDIPALFSQRLEEDDED
jgi:toxin ParE1/3/4